MGAWLFKTLINICLLLIKTETSAGGSERIELPLSALSLSSLGLLTVKSCQILTSSRLTAAGSNFSS